MQLEWIAELYGIPDHVQGMLARVGDAALLAEGLDGRYQATVLVTDDEGIAAINREQRGLDTPTDVLSFPTARYPRGTTAKQNAARLRRELDIETGHIHLGEIIISLPTAQRQAVEYNHALAREISFLFAHGMLHLLGYDHQTEDERAAMRAMEETVMEKTGISRELSDADFELVAAAREVMQNAYVPYSRYKVGAALRCADGSVFRGCNVENASYGMTICAERNAITTAVAEGCCDVVAIAITGEGSMPYPCGACRQFLREFGTDVRIIVANEETVMATTLADLLPNSFGPESLKEVDA